MHPRVSYPWVEERPQGPTPTKMIASDGGICYTLCCENGALVELMSPFIAAWNR